MALARFRGVFLQTHELEVESGPEGFANFLARVRGLFGIDTQQQMDLTFDCAEPATGTCRLSLVLRLHELEHGCCWLSHH